jgi:hypothetical protein
MQIWAKLLMGDNNSNNIADLFFNCKKSYQRKKTQNSSKIEHIFYTIKIFLLKI